MPPSPRRGDFGPTACSAWAAAATWTSPRSPPSLLTHGGGPLDYVGDDKIPGPVLPLMCVPTTAGTGSEVSAAAVLTDTDNQIKVGMLSNYLRPAAAVVDPLLTVSCPPKVTADSGIDALTHAIEAYTAVDNAVFPAAARRAFRLPGPASVGRHAGGAGGEPDRRPPAAGGARRPRPGGREGMALGATLAGMAFSNVGVAAVHALEYPVGGATHCSHGAGNGLLLPFVMRYNLRRGRRRSRRWPGCWART